MTDDRLLERAQRGDREALDELCRREWRPIYALAYSALGNAAEAQDLTQEAFLRALRSLPAYRVTGAPFHAYLKTIALNLVRDGWRKRRHATVPLDDGTVVVLYDNTRDRLGSGAWMTQTCTDASFGEEPWYEAKPEGFGQDVILE